MKLKDYRNKLGISIKEASEASGVPLRTYIRYEQNDSYGDIYKRERIVDRLRDRYEITEDTGILNIDQIKDLCAEVFEPYENKIEYCFLFGSYAKGYSNEKSDVDLCVSTSLTGLKFFGLAEELRNTLHKKVDLIRLSDLSDNFDLIKEIMKDGIKIYG